MRSFRKTVALLSSCLFGACGPAGALSDSAFESGVQHLSSGLPEGFPVSHVFCGGTDNTRILTYEDGLLYVDGVVTVTMADTKRVEQLFYSGKLVTTPEVAKSGFNILPFAPPSVDLHFQVQNAVCGNRDRTVSCSLDQVVLRNGKPGLSEMLAIPGLTLPAQAQLRPPIFGRCRNNDEDTQMQLALTNGFNFRPYAMAPHMIGAAFGKNLALKEDAPTPDETFLPTRLSDTTVKVDGQVASLFYVSPEQVNILMPENLDFSRAIHIVEVFRGPGWRAAKGTFSLQTATVGLASVYTWTGNSHITLYSTGLASAGLNNVRVVLNGKTFELDHQLFDFLGAAPGYVGYEQINVNVQSRLTPEELTRPIQVQLTGSEGFELAPSNTVVVEIPIN